MTVDTRSTTEAIVDGPRTPWRTGYEHLEPVWTEYAALRPADARRARLRTELILGYRQVARNIARKHGRRGDLAEDLEQVAHLGLVLAVDRFDPSRGSEFLAFAVPTITGEVLRHFRDRTTPLRLPRGLRELQTRIHRSTAELAQRHGRSPRPSEIAAHLGVDREHVLQALAAEGAGYALSLDQHPDGEGRTDTWPRFEAALGRVEPLYDLVEHYAGLAPLLAELPERERQILTLRFVDGLTQFEIGRRVGISQMHVSRLLSRTIQVLRGRLVDE